jgi:hypothetical protein
MKTCLVFLALMAAVLPAAAAVDADFGLIGITGFETARLNAFCDGSVVPTPCDITFEFHDINGRTLKQVSMILQPETSGFADFSVGAATFVPGRIEIDPCFKILRGTAQGSVEIFDNFTQRTRMLINWGDGARARSAADVDFGTVAITRSDIARMGASCEGDGSVVPAPCDITFEFHDANGRVLKSERKSVPAGTGAYFDLNYAESGSTERRVLIDPCWTVANGAAVLDLQTVDSFTGLTLTQGYPAALVTSTLN